MSVTGPHSAGSASQYGSAGGGLTRGSLPALPALPPMSALLRHESEATGDHNSLTERQSQSPYSMISQPTWLYPGGQPHSPLNHYTQSNTPPLPAHENRMVAASDSHILTPPHRELRRVTQRRPSPSEEFKQEDRSTSSPSINERKVSHRNSVDSRIYSRQGSGSSASSSSIMTPRNGHTRAMPISKLLSDSP
jgi:hypothetical protein